VSIVIMRNGSNSAITRPELLVFGMHRPMALVALLAGLSAGCSLDVDGIRQGAEQLKNEVESSNLMDCKDEKGDPLPDWVCKKTDAAETPATD
jgi:hypothetical protein